MLTAQALTSESIVYQTQLAWFCCHFAEATRCTRRPSWASRLCSHQQRARAEARQAQQGQRVSLHCRVPNHRHGACKGQPAVTWSSSR